MSAKSPPPETSLPGALGRMVSTAPGEAYPIAYNHDNVSQTQNPQRWQLSGVSAAAPIYY